MSWEKEQEFERDWWVCHNTLGEEEKQVAYAKRMGLKFFHDGKSPYNIDMGKKAVLDIGGGPVSLLLKCVNVVGAVIDPCKYPHWVNMRYEDADIGYTRMKGEDIEPENWVVFDEVWIYNVLQHTESPEKVIANALAISKVVRIFEWIDTYVSPGHPHVLTEEFLNKSLGGIGKTEQLNQPCLVGKCYYGIFKGKHYEKI